LLALVVGTSVHADQAGQAGDAYQVAVEHFTAQRWEMAEHELATFIQQFPEHPRAADAAFLLAEVLIQRKDYAASRRAFLEFLARSPDHRYASRALFRAAGAAQLAGSPDEAYQDFERFRREYPNDERNAQVLYYLGEIAMARRDWVTAQQLLREGLRVYPNGLLNEETLFLLGRCLESQGDVDAARKEYRRLVQTGTRLAVDAQVQLGNSYYTRGRYEEAATEFQHVIQRFANSPRVPQARYWLGMCHVARQRWDEAVEILSGCMADYPDHELAPSISFWLAEAHRRGGDLQTALLFYQRTASAWPGSPWADDSWLVLIQSMFTDEQHDAVLQYADEFEREHRSSPLWSRVRQIVGRTYLKQERFDEAVQVLREIVQQTEQHDAETPGQVRVETPEMVADEQQALYYLGQAYLGGGQADAALQTFARIDPQAATPETLRGIRTAQAAALIGADRFAEAIPLLEQSLADPQQQDEATACRLQLVVAHARSGQLDQALELAEQFSEDEQSHPLFWQASNELAEAAYQSQRFEIAERFFRQLTSDDAPEPFVAQGWSGIGWLHYRSGDFDAAAAAFGWVPGEHAESALAAEARLMQAKSLQQTGRSAEALDGYLRLIASRNAGAHLPAALFAAAGLQESQDAPDAALPLLVRLIDEHPEFEQIDAALYRLAWLLIDLQRPDEAAGAFQKISDHHRTSRYWADATYRLAEHAARAERHAEATRLLTLVIDTPESNREVLCYALYLQAQLAASAGQWDQVAAPLERLLAEAPDSLLRLASEYWLAESDFQQQQWDRAAERFARLDARIDEHGDLWMAMIPLRRSQILVEQQRWDEAHDIAQSIAHRFPGFRQQYEADYVIGRCLAMKARFDEARQWYERVVRSPEGGKTETAAKAQWMIGESYFHQKNYDEAIRAYQRVDSLFAYPHWQAAALLQAGKCYELRGERDEAVLAFVRILEHYPETTFAREASQRITDRGRYR
jgi:TolA-binding protein